MGLSDIDEDDVPVLPTQGPSPGRAVATLDDLFGPPSSSRGAPITPDMPPTPSTYVTVPNNVPPAACASALDAFFMPSAPEAVPPSAAASGKEAMIHVDGDDATNLLDLSRPAQSTQHHSLESCLDAFEQRRQNGNTRIGNTTNSLGCLTRNHDDNKVKARLLPLLSYYDVLGVAPDALPEEIKRRYKQLAVSLHPDKTGGHQSKEEEDLFKAITKAYEVLADEEQRKSYDVDLALGVAAPLA